MLKRPKPGEDEEELLQFQREFLAQQGAPSASVLSKSGDKRKPDSATSSIQQPARDVVQMDDLPSVPPVAEHTPPVKKSRFRTRQDRKAKPATERQRDTVSGEDPEDLIERHDTHMAVVLTKIIERDTRGETVRMPRQTRQPFPPVQTLEAEQNEGVRKKKSLFAQQFENSPSDFGVDYSSSVSRSADAGSGYGDSMEVEECVPELPVAGVIEGTGLSATFGKEDVKRIHQENLSKIAAMSEEEILEEQQKLLEMMDPKLLEFLRTRPAKTENQSNVKALDSEEPSTSLKSKSKKKTTEDIPMPLETEKTWVHMDKVEYDKLEWMKDLPAPKTGDNRTGKQARFDFKGNLMLTDEGVPVNIGLHHHGDEPERAGYTLEELFQLARSSNIQQRVIALQTLARVVQQTKAGHLEGLVQTPILPSILDAGVVFLLRWSMDDSVDSVVASAVLALNSLLVNHADQDCLDHVDHWYQGHVTPSHKASTPEGPGLKLPDVQEEKPEETDADMSRRDVILALVSRMSLLQRLRYILDTSRPQTPTVIHILEILTRVARHSTELAYQVLAFRGLMDLILKEFLPLSLKVEDSDKTGSSVYGKPLPAAMTLVRTLCQSGRNMAAILLSRFQIQARLLRYLVDFNSETSQLPEHAAHSLQVACLRTWRVCLLYRLGDALYLDLYPVLVEQLKQCQAVLERPAVVQERLCAVVAVLEAVVCVAASTPVAAGFKQSQDGSSSMETEHSESETTPAVQWSHVTNLVQPMRLLLSSVMADIGEQYQFKKYSLQLPVACLNFLSTFYSKWHETPHAGEGTVSTLEEVEEVYTSCMRHWGKFGFQLILRSLSKRSNLLSPDAVRKSEMAACLPELGCCTATEDQVLPVVRTTSPFGFLSSMLRLVYSLCKVNKGLLNEGGQGDSKAVSPRSILSNEDIWTYLKKLASSNQGNLSGNHFTKFENHFIFYFLKIATLPSYSEFVSSLDVKTLHSVALTLFTSLHHGDEHLAHDLLSTVLFNQLFWRTSAEEGTTESLADLSLSDTTPTHLRNATEADISFRRDQLCTTAKSRLNAIRGTYVSTLAEREEDVTASRNMYLMNPMATSSFLTSNIGECLLPLDWMFFPLIDLYNTFSSVGADIQNVLSSTQVSRVCDVLCWIYLLEVHRARLVEPISITLKVSRVMCAFLTGNDMFLERSVSCYLAGLLRQYTRPSLIDKMDFDSRISGLPSFYDLYVGMLQQFEAVSFGDSVFACYILIPLQQCHSVQFRKSVWTEYTGILRTLSLPLQELLIPVERYLEPEESDVGLLRLYYQSLLGATLRPQWSPVLYLMAVHHVNRFLYTQDGKHQQLKTGMIRQLLGTSNKEIQQHLLHYKLPDVTQKHGLVLYTELPPLRQKLIDSVTNK